MRRIARAFPPRLLLHLAAGLLAGVAYAVVDLAFDEKIGAGPLHGLLASIHTFIDHILPILTGLLFGAVTYALAQRSRLALSESRRAELLVTRLERVERDQAVWVLAASVLHEVRNPLHSLGLLVDDLTQHLDTRDTLVADLAERARKQVTRIDAELDVLKGLHEKGRPEPRVVPLRALIATVIDDMALLANPIAVTVSGDDGVSAFADANYVRLILENLMSNSMHAVRALATSPSISIELTSCEGLAIVRIRDNGPGPTDTETLFEPRRSTKDGGLGLGLAISRALARSLEGDVRFEGRVSDETVFRLTLPMACR